VRFPRNRAFIVPAVPTTQERPEMNQSTTTDNSHLQLYPPMIQGQTEPVKGAHVGVPLVAYDLVSDGEGAKVQIDPPFVGIWESGDVVKLWLVNDTTLLSFTTIGDPNVAIFLRIPRNRLHPDEVNQLYYTVERNSNNTGTSEPPLQVLYNRIRPGLKDRFPEIDGHSELELDLSDLIEQGVGKDFVSAPVCFSYPYCRAYDTISLKCNGEIKTFPVSKDQAPEPPNPGTEKPTTLCFTVEREFLDKAKRQNKVLNFSYTVTDQLLNGPDPDAVWSAAVAVNEDLDGTLLDEPILLERKEDYPGDDAETIDLEKLAGNPLLLVVMTKDNRFEVGDEIVATYTTTGQTDPVVVRDKVEEDPFLGKLPCFLEVPNNKVFAGSKVTAIYELHRPNVGLVGSSNTATATVTGTIPVDLKPPTLVAPATNPVDVLAYEEGVTVRVEHLLALPGDQARLLEVDPKPDAKPFPLLTLNPNKRANFKLDPAFLVERRGTTIKLRWELIRGGKSEGESPDLVLTIQPIAENDRRLPTPNIAGNTGKELDVQDLTADARILAVKWPLFEPGQPIWITCAGFNNNGDPVSKDVRSGELNESVDGLLVEAPIEWLKVLKDGTEQKTTMKVNLDRIANANTAVHFPTRSYIVKTIDPILSENFELVPARTLTRGQNYDIPSMLIEYLEGNIPCFIGPLFPNIPQIPGKIEGNALQIHYGGNGLSSKISLKFKSAYSSVSFWHWHSDFKFSISLYDKNDKILDILTIPPSPSHPTHVTLTAEGIARFEIFHAPYDFLIFDNFIFTL
jgi:hypothetical protein